MVAPKVTPPTKKTEFAERLNQKPLRLLQHTEGLLRRRTVDAIIPVLPPPLATTLQEVSDVADTSLAELVVDLDRVSDQQLQPARILIGLSFVGFGALFTAFLMLYLCTMHSELSPAEQMRRYWYQYVWCVCLGIAGMFVLGREAMRSRS